jgi:hypothetical protein
VSREKTTGDVNVVIEWKLGIRNATLSLFKKVRVWHFGFRVFVYVLARVCTRAWLDYAPDLGVKSTPSAETRQGNIIYYSCTTCRSCKPTQSIIIVHPTCKSCQPTPFYNYSTCRSCMSTQFILIVHVDLLVLSAPTAPSAEPRKGDIIIVPPCTCRSCRPTRSIIIVLTCRSCMPTRSIIIVHVNRAGLHGP